MYAFPTIRFMTILLSLIVYRDPPNAKSCYQQKNQSEGNVDKICYRFCFKNSRSYN